MTGQLAALEQASRVLAGAGWLRRPQTQAVLAALASAGHQARVVGGAVRNALMGKPVGDIDIATTAPPEQVVRAAAAAGLAAIPTGIAHGTITVVCNHHPFEVTTLRRDIETDGRHAIVAFTDDWHADAARRDFTMNALYCDGDGTLFDPLGGLPDVLARKVRFIGSADARIAEDTLRILRFFRFHAEHGHGVQPDREGLAACTRGHAGLRRLSAERIRVELMKLLLAEGAHPALGAMFDHGILVDVLGAAPRLDAFARLGLLEARHACPPSAARRLGVLALHGPDDVPRLVERLRLSNDERGLLQALTRPGRCAIGPSLDPAQARRLLYETGGAHWGDLVLARWAWSRDDANAQQWSRLLDLPRTWPIPVFPLTGADLLSLGLQPGPKVGETLRSIERRWIASDFELSREALIAAARQLIADGGR